MSGEAQINVSPYPPDVAKKYKKTRYLWSISVRRPNGEILFLEDGISSDADSARKEAESLAEERGYK